ncbi:hypothetical protein IFM61606_01917 [Aspergillus udagawae]|uniref:Uncharacterized protein n=1 Tax=Aspergillus udagawae TaxID=91492 RepID=A0A8E0QHV6_9EURO|nr:uncharacterized protein Aud_001409 [Aspergillus udagawae]GFF33550.1 hypothetical protein IFM51744_02150 [Aspergillus udagawae]GFF79656.1 hypothetical protein IFM53868_02655 [Aspergillus udagawae]GFG22063.1 hypothetical protein IFM61606_01917 [Aspergillus udagawae]GIC85577.1 hypothetical protein Aud_001409 [Aspergillus udagawae]
MSDLENMDTLRFRERVHQRRRHSQPLTDEEITYITQQSAELADEALAGKALKCFCARQIFRAETPGDQVNPDQIRWASKAEQVLSKPLNEITMDDARNLTSKEARAFADLPATGSVASHVHSAAEKNAEGS